MRIHRLVPVASGLILCVAACSAPPRGEPAAPAGPQSPPVARLDPRETHLADLQQLTFGGENAEAYWSFNGQQLIFQTTRPPFECDRIMRMPADGSAAPTQVSTGKGRTTCSYFMPGDQEVIYASTQAVSDSCPAPPDHSKGYVWALYDYSIYKAKADGTDVVRITDNPGYNAEATVCGRDGSIVFTSDRDGDLELYRMDADGKNVARLTHSPGYDGGAFFSADCTKLVWRASRPQGEDLADYQGLLAEHLVRPTKLEIFVANGDGSDARQVTYLDAASFGPFWHPSGNRILFSSNYGAAGGREFDIWAIDTSGANLERITWTGGFDGFPMFSPDGRWLAFSSNRNQAKEGDTNVFIARWVEQPPAATAGGDSSPRRFLDDVSWLASDARQGRGVGSAGLAAAGEWIEDQMKKIGVAGGIDGGYRQPFEVATALERDPATALAIDGVAVAADGFVPLSFSAPAKALSAATVDVGWGVVADELGIDEYKGKKVEGKIAVVRRFVSESNAYKTDEQRNRYGDLQLKAFVARQHGAVGLIVIDAPPVGGPEEAPLPTLRASSGADGGIVALAVTQAAGKALLDKGKHRIKATVGLTPVREEVYNVVGRIRAGVPAADRLDGAILIGAHYDHLGMGGPNALDAESGIHNGADDNASGVAALLEVARTLRLHAGELRRDVWLVAFSGEESGVLGSTHLVEHPPAGLEPSKLVAMLNMDMVGRMRDNHVSVLGGESAAEWASLVDPACAAARVRCELGGSGYGPSDHSPFYSAGAPVLHFFTGGHLDYHRASDDAQTINAAGGARVAQIVAAVALAAASRPERLTYRKVAPAATAIGDLRARGASMGTMPAYTDEPDAAAGMLLSDVVPDGPAAKAGLHGGDRIVAVGATEIRNVHDFMFVLQAAKPGDQTKVTLLRDGKKLTVDVTFGKPRPRR